MRDMPADIRGVMLGCFHIFGNVGTLVFTSISSAIVTDYGAKAPFVSMCISQAVMALIGLILALTGNLKQ
jgi:hypothetical protein